MAQHLFFLNQDQNYQLGQMVARFDLKAKGVYLEDMLQFLSTSDLLYDAPFAQLKKVEKRGPQVGFHPEIDDDGTRQLRVAASVQNMLLRPYLRSLSTALVNFYQATGYPYPGKELWKQLPLRLRKS